MNKLLLLILLSYETISMGGNLCVGYVGRRFRKQAPVVLNSLEEPHKACNCECYKYQRSLHEHQHKCLKCGHRLLPHNVESKDIVILTPETQNYINAWKQNQHTQFEELTLDKVIEYELEEIQKSRKNLD